LLTVLLDQVSKFLAVRYLQPLGPAGVPIIGGFIRLVYLENSGVSFGQLQRYSTWIALFGFAVVAGLLLTYRHLLTPSRWANLAVGLILGGAMGNAVDRIRTAFRLGLANTYVVDFIDLRYWAVFNVADSAITVGGVLFAFYLAFFHKGWPAAEKREKEQPCPPPENPLSAG
jgi:signal peptidase II